MTTYGIIGAGHIGSAVARALIAAGDDVVIANSRGAETLSGLIAELGPRARAATAGEAGSAGEVVIVTVPFTAVPDIPVEPLAGKIVIDTNNYIVERDGSIGELDRGETTVGAALQSHLPMSKVARGFNHIEASEIGAMASPPGAPGRRALATSSDHPEAAAHVIELYDRIGFDGVDASPLSESWRFERGRPAYDVRLTRDELIANLALATRTI